MELTHSFTVPAGVDDTWRTLTDLELVGGCFPGATVTEFSDEAFSGTVKVKLGPIAMMYAGSGTFLERDDSAHRAVIDAKGKDKRGNGTAAASVTIQLTPEGETTTRADVKTDLTVTGKPAQFGRGVMQDVSDKLLQQFIDCIQDRLAPAPAPAEETAAAAAVPAPTERAPTERAPAAPTPVEPVPPTPLRPRAPAEEEAAIDLGRTVGPVLLKTYGPRIAVGAVVLVLVVWLVRRCRR